jgi:hypothetical protein
MPSVCYVQVEIKVPPNWLTSVSSSWHFEVLKGFGLVWPEKTPQQQRSKNRATTSFKKSSRRIVHAPEI